jgi:hypothetical protein
MKHIISLNLTARTSSYHFNIQNYNLSIDTNKYLLNVMTYCSEINIFKSQQFELLGSCVEKTPHPLKKNICN